MEIIAIFVILCIVVAFVGCAYWLVVEVRNHNARVDAERRARHPVSSAPVTGTPRYPETDTTSPALAWNVFVIVVGILIAAIGLLNGFIADPRDSAIRQTVSALWVIQGLFGLLIPAVGILGATLVHALQRR